MSIIKIHTFFLFFCVFMPFVTMSQDFSIAEMKRMATSDFSEIETMASKRGYRYDKSYFEKVPDAMPTKTHYTEFSLQDESATMTWITTTYYDPNEYWKNKLIPPVQIAKKIVIEFNNSDILEKYKLYLKQNNYKKGIDFPIFDEMSTIYEDANDKKLMIKVGRREKKEEKYKYYVSVRVETKD